MLKLVKYDYFENESLPKRHQLPIYNVLYFFKKPNHGYIIVF